MSGIFTERVMQTTLSRREIVSVALGAVLSGCHGSGKQQTGIVHIALANSAALMHLPVLLAQELGYFQAESLAISLDDTTSSSKAAQALLGRSANIASAGFEQAVVLNREGRDCVVFWLLFEAPDNVLFGSPAVKSPAHSLNDLIGRTVGVSTVGSSIQRQIEYAMRRRGINPDKVGFVTTPNQSARIAALQRGLLDAAIMGEPGASFVKQKLPAAPVLADFTNPAQLRELLGITAYPGNALFSTGAWVKNNPETVWKITHAISRAVEWAKSHSPAEIVQRLPALSRSGEISVMETAVGNMVQHMSSTGRTSPEASQAVARLMAISDGVDRSFTNDFASVQSR